jgi:hypothetical protein
LLAVASCDCQPAAFTRCEGVPQPPSIEGGVVWHKDIQPIIEARCGRCHVEEGLAPFPLTTLDDVRANADAVKDAVISRRMPPWMPAPCCNSFRDDASLTSDQIALISKWVDDDTPEGNPDDVGVPLAPIGVLPRVDATLIMNDVYLPDVSAHDDTRCFMLDWPFDEKKFVVGFGVTPGVRELVHHALVTVAPVLVGPAPAASSSASMIISAVGRPGGKDRRLQKEQDIALIPTTSSFSRSTTRARTTTPRRLKIRRASS